MPRHLIGSRYFFGGYPDFSSHDADYVEVVPNADFPKKRVIRGQGMDLFQLSERPLESMLSDDLNAKLPMVVGKWLVPEFCEEVGFAFEDLPRLRPLIDSIDEKHAYEKDIYESYLENGKFHLTEEQRLRAYNRYRSSRGMPLHKEEQTW